MSSGRERLPGPEKDKGTAQGADQENRDATGVLTPPPSSVPLQNRPSDAPTMMDAGMATLAPDDPADISTMVPVSPADQATIVDVGPHRPPPVSPVPHSNPLELQPGTVLGGRYEIVKMWKNGSDMGGSLQYCD